MITEKDAVKVIADEILRAVRTVSDSNAKQSANSLYGAITNAISNAPIYAQQGDKMAERIISTFNGIASINIQNATIDTAQIRELYASYAEFYHLVAEQAHFDDVDVEQLKADVAEIIYLSAQRGNFDFAKVQNLVAGAMIIREVVGNKVCIDNLVATNAMFVQATLGTLVLKGEDGDYYEVTVASDGTISTKEVYPSIEEIESGVMVDTGRKIVETDLAVHDLNAENIYSQSAVISEIFTDSLEADKITAGEAFIASAAIQQLYVISISAIGDTLDLSANQSVRITVGDAVNALKVGGRNYLRKSKNMVDANFYSLITREPIPVVGYFQVGDVQVV